MYSEIGTSWLNFVVRVTLGRHVQSDEFRRGLAKLRAIETWLGANHFPLPLFDQHGRPKSEIVAVFFDSADPQKALAFRGLCAGLGITGSMLSQRVVLNRSARTRLH